MVPDFDVNYAAICGAGVDVGGDSAIRPESMLNAESSSRLASWVIGIFSAFALK